MTQRHLLQTAATLAADYLETLPTRGVAPTEAALDGLRALDRPLPDRPADPLAVLKQLHAVASPATMASSGSRYFGFVVGGTLPAALAANWLATAWDQDAGLAVLAPGAAAIEAVALRWLLEALHLPPECGGGFVTGATMANFTALAAARHALLERAGWDVEADGLFGAPPLTVVVGDEVHVSVVKARGDAAGDRGAAGGRDVLVRRHGVARPGGDAHQRVVLGDDRRRCGTESRGDDADRAVPVAHPHPQ